MSKKKKTFVLDTNVLLSDPGALGSFDEHTIIIPLVVLEELDNHKNRPDEVGKNARYISRQLDAFRENGGSLSKGVKLPNGGTLKVLHMTAENYVPLPKELSLEKADNAIIAFTACLAAKSDCTLVSKDINVRIKCDSLGIKSEDYTKMRVAGSQDELYSGVSRVDVDFEVMTSFYKNQPISLGAEIESTLCPNEIVVMKDYAGSKSAVVKFMGPGEPLERLADVEDVYGLRPRNKEQQFALDLLLDDRIKLVSITGAAGCGKTLLALAAGLAQVLGTKQYEHLIVSRPVQPMGKDIGFLPGTIEEKMDPWIAPIKDNLNFLLGGRKKTVSKKRGEPDREFKRDPYIDMMFEDKKIEIEALTYIRGRSIPNSYMIIDECQNLSVHELKTIITRIGDGTKIILLGDLEQIDNTHVDMFTNGLTYAVERFKEYKIAGHITLLKGERSELATLAAKIL
jgi:PhoH-like ATPase